MRRPGDRFALPTARGDALVLQPCNHGLGDDPEADRAWLRNVPRPWAVDLFAGAGGLSLGLQEAGFQVVAAADSDLRAVQTHRANLPGIAWPLDLSDPTELLERLRERGITNVDLVAGGPPCQPFSRAGATKLRSLVADGKRSVDDDRVGLWSTFLGVVDALTPRAVVLENVPDMARWADGELLVELITALRERGFDPDARVLNAWEYGVPQHRARLFVVAMRGVPFAWPRRRGFVTLADAIGDLPPIGPGQRERMLPYTGSPATAFQRRARRRMTRSTEAVIWDHCSRDLRDDDAEAFSLLPQGGTYADLPPRLRRYRSDIFEDKYKRLAWATLSRTITAHIARDGYWYIHPDQGRTLSIREAARIQTFPDDFRFAGHPSVQLRQIGNAVPPSLARAVGRRLRAALDLSAPSPRIHPSSRFAAWAPPESEIDPWLVASSPWLVLAGELTLRRCARSVAADAWTALVAHAYTPARALKSSDRLERAFAAAGLPRRRCEPLLAVANKIVDEFGGRIPSAQEQLTSLPGVGEHVATAVRCFAFGQRAVFLDSATKRVAVRVSGRDCSSAWTTRLELYRLAGAAGPNRQFNLALRAIAKHRCLAQAPRCSACSLAEICRSRTPTSVRNRPTVTT